MPPTHTHVLGCVFRHLHTQACCPVCAHTLTHPHPRVGHTHTGAGMFTCSTYPCLSCLRCHVHTHICLVLSCPGHSPRHTLPHLFLPTLVHSPSTCAHWGLCSDTHPQVRAAGTCPVSLSRGPRLWGREHIAKGCGVRPHTPCSPLGSTLTQRCCK